MRIDRETRTQLDRRQTTPALLAALEAKIAGAGGGDRGRLRQRRRHPAAAGRASRHLCRRRGVWLSLDPKPVHHLDLTGLSLITPNRKEAFELARLPDETRNTNPLADSNLMQVATGC